LRAVALASSSVCKEAKKKKYGWMAAIDAGDKIGTAMVPVAAI